MKIEFIQHKGNMYPKLIPESYLEYVVFPLAGAFVDETTKKIICANLNIPKLFYPVKRLDYPYTLTYNAVILPLAPFFMLARAVHVGWFRIGRFLFEHNLLDLSSLKEGDRVHWFFFRYLTFKRKK